MGYVNEVVDSPMDDQLKSKVLRDQRHPERTDSKIG